jgi:hypothetical protein
MNFFFGITVFLYQDKNAGKHKIVCRGPHDPRETILCFPEFCSIQPLMTGFLRRFRNHDFSPSPQASFLLSSVIDQKGWSVVVTQAVFKALRS